MKLAHIVACSENGVIGRDGQLPWRLPEDLKFFKETTMGHMMLMGRKTYESIGRPLPGRKTLVITRQKNFEAPEGVLVAHSVDEALKLAEPLRKDWGDTIFVVGGGEIYNTTFPMTDLIYLTLIHEHVDGDTFYPRRELNDYRLTRREDRGGNPPFSFLLYERC